MKTSRPLVCLFALLILPLGLFAQDSLMQALVAESRLWVDSGDDGFSGPGWDFLAEKSRAVKYVLVGEDHFSNEIPRFVRAIHDLSDFDYFYIEVDPYSTQILERTLRDASPGALEGFLAEYGHLLSFYSLRPEFGLLQHIIESGTRVLGSDQVVMYADRLIFQDWLPRTQSAEAREIYSEIIAQSRERLAGFLEDPKDFMSIHFMTPEFDRQLARLEELDLSREERQIIADMRRSVRIYREQNHPERVRLLLSGIMRDYTLWSNGRTLFKYGANHMMRGESLLTVFDIGNLVADLADSQYTESFHIMIVGKSGMTGSIFEPLPPSPVDPEGFYLKHLKPFLDAAQGDSWQVFDLVPMRKQLESGKLRVENQNLRRTIKGFDALVVIPELTPAQLLNTGK